MQEDKNQLDDFNLHIEELKKKRHALLVRGNEEDFISKNKVVASGWSTIATDNLKTRTEEAEDRINRTLQRKEGFDVSEYKRKVFLMHKWSILKVKV